MCLTGSVFPFNQRLGSKDLKGAMRACVGASHFSRVLLFVTPWTVAHQASLFMGFSRQEYWSGLPCPPPGDLPDPGTEFVSLCLLQWQVDSLPLAPPGKPHLYPALIN